MIAPNKCSSQISIFFSPQKYVGHSLEILFFDMLLSNHKFQGEIRKQSEHFGKKKKERKKNTLSQSVLTTMYIQLKYMSRVDRKTVSSQIVVFPNT